MHLFAEAKLAVGIFCLGAVISFDGGMIILIQRHNYLQCTYRSCIFVCNHLIRYGIEEEEISRKGASVNLDVMVDNREHSLST